MSNTSKLICEIVSSRRRYAVSIQHLQFGMDCCRAVKVVFDAALDRLEAEQKKHVWAHMLDSIEKCNPFHARIA